MFFTSGKKYPDNVKEVYIVDNNEYPNLHRLSDDFGFAVLNLCENAIVPRYAVCEVGIVRGVADPVKVSPEFDALNKLEAFIADNIVDIIQQYLFGDESLVDEVPSVNQSGFLSGFIAHVNGMVNFKYT